MGFSFFGIRWGVFEIRGIQVAERIGGKINPTTGFEEDVCIFVGSRPRIPLPKKSFFDPGEKHLQLKVIQKNRSARILAWSNSALHAFQDRFRRAVFLVPQHHCNFANEQRPDRPVTTVGIVGNAGSLTWFSEEVRSGLERAGLTFLMTESPRNQPGAVAAYRQLDIQLVFRPGPRMENRSPLKLLNAGSFGIPTVAYPEPTFAMECEGAYLPALTIEELVEGATSLVRDPDLYRKYAEAGRELAEKYHIDEVLTHYRKLEEVCFDEALL